MISQELLESDYSLFKEYLVSECGIVLGDNKQYLVRSRLLPLLRQFEIDSYTNLISRVVKSRDSSLNNAVIDAMTTNETLWFRDGHPFEVLKADIFPKLQNKRTPVRIWCAACSSGQEPYSIAMSLLEYKTQNASAFSGGVEIIGTDISNNMLDQCRRATYDNLSLSRGLSNERLERFFEPAEVGAKNESRQLKREVTRMVSFRSMNLFDSYAALGSFDLIFCRNVLIYFSIDGKKRILQQIASSLQSGGTLFLGASESLSGISNDFDMNRSGQGIFYVKKQ
ncbi:protein-glutamate O-methyltransferase CheR [Alteromonadaceae bacterium M269]|nr:protein-glutamate O-methyltransferase CheR [Alteromonadaceae bacterium M269]